MAKLVDLDHKWAHQIGRAFIAFGSIEHTVLELLKLVPRDPIYDSVATLRLSQKIDLLVSILDKRDAGEAAYLAATLRAIKPLLRKRNLIAHNPLMLDLYVTSDGDPVVLESIRHPTNEQEHMSFKSVVALRESSEHLAHELLVAHLSVMAALTRGAP